MARNIRINPFPSEPIEAQPVEICEHKGEGHPDSLCDAVCEAASRALSLAYLDRYGVVLHHNLDKGLLVAGQSRPQFGGGVLLSPMQLILCGRASPMDSMAATVRIALEAARQQLARLVPQHVGDFRLRAEIHAGSGDLQQVFAGGRQVPIANDTSYGAGYAPYSRLESAVQRAGSLLRSAPFRARFPVAGADYKVMGLRQGAVIQLVIALAFVDRFVESAAHYFQLKQEMHRYLAERLESVADIRLNTLDQPTAGSERDLYLTVTGLSCEMGDDGQVGRGNRVNGLITPNRPMSLEAAAGKNPVSHTGKLYNVLAHLMAQRIHAEIEAVQAVNVLLLSAIGQPVDQPQLASIDILADGELTPALQRQIHSIADRCLAGHQEVTRMLLSGTIGIGSA